MTAEFIKTGDLVRAIVTNQIPLDFVIPKTLLDGQPALYLGEVERAGRLLSYVLYSGTVLVISREKLTKCTTTFAQA